MTPRARRRWLVGGGIVAALVVGIAVFLAVFDWTLLKGPIERTVSAKTGREFHIDGRIEVRLRPPVRVVFNGVRMGNADWSRSGRDLFQADRVATTIRVLPLFAGRVVLPMVEVDAPRVSLEKDGERANWNIGSGEPSEGSVAPEIGQIAIRRGEVRYDDPGQRIAVTAAVDSTSSGDPERPLAIRARGRVFGEPFSLDARGGGILQLRETDEPYPLVAEGRVGETRARVEGTVRGLAAMDALDARFAIAGPTLSELQRLLPVALPQTPPYELSGLLQHAGSDWTLSDARGRVGDSDIAGTVKYAGTAGDRPRPRLTADLVSRVLDLDDLAPLLGAPPSTKPGETASPRQRAEAAKREKSGPVSGRTIAQQKRAEAVEEVTGKPPPTANPERRVLPDLAFGVDRWPRMDADVRLRGKRVQSAQWLPIDNLDAKAVLDDARLRIAPLTFGVAGGEVTLDVRLDGRQKPLDARADVRFARLGLDRLIPKLKATQGSAGRIYGSLELAGRGPSLSRILATSDGRLQLAVDGGRLSNLILEVIGLDGGEVVKYLLSGDRDVKLRCAIADFPVKQGVATAEALLVDTEDTNIVGKGTVNIGTERLDLALYPRPKDPSIFVLRAPINIGGSFASPTTVPDLGEVGLRAGAAILLGLVNPVLALAPMIETGPGKDSDCARALGDAHGWARAKSEVGDGGSPGRAKPPPKGTARPAGKASDAQQKPAAPR
jgi:uncharacterized protein involved in outer membrane biogenesis